jgi:hypothetical protein
LLKTKSFLQFHKVQSKAHTPTRIRALPSLTIALNQFSNKFVILVGGGKLKVNSTTLQTRRAKGQEMNKWFLAWFQKIK